LQAKALLIASFAVACATGGHREATPAAIGGTSAAAAPAEPAAAPCRTREEIQAAYGKLCSVIGRYRLRIFPSKGGGSLGDWPIVELDDGAEVMIESIWDSSRKPDRKAVAALTGKRVRVTGKLNASPPKSSPENFGFPCLSPVEELRLED
jgi:hypothetical protein